MKKIVTQRHSLLVSLSEVREKTKSEGFVQLKTVDYYAQRLACLPTDYQPADLQGNQNQLLPLQDLFFSHDCCMSTKAIF